MVEVPLEWLHDTVYGRKEVAEIFNVDVQTVTKWAQRGIIGFYRTPSHVRCYPECEVRRVASGIPAPDYVKELAEADKARYHAKWQEGWRKNAVTTGNYEGRIARMAAKRAAREDAE